MADPIHSGTPLIVPVTLPGGQSSPISTSQASELHRFWRSTVTNWRSRRANLSAGVVTKRKNHPLWYNLAEIKGNKSEGQPKTFDQRPTAIAERDDGRSVASLWRFPRKNTPISRCPPCASLPSRWMSSWQHLIFVLCCPVHSMTFLSKSSTLSSIL